MEARPGEHTIRECSSRVYLGSLERLERLHDVMKLSFTLSHKGVILVQASTLRELLPSRTLSGDLVFRDGKIYESPDWLFQWEKASPYCYARRAIRMKLKLADHTKTHP